VVCGLKIANGAMTRNKQQNRQKNRPGARMQKRPTDFFLKRPLGRAKPIGPPMGRGLAAWEAGSRQRAAGSGQSVAGPN
jgi:hypothetical protein